MEHRRWLSLGFIIVNSHHRKYCGTKMRFRTSCLFWLLCLMLDGKFPSPFLR